MNIQSLADILSRSNIPYAVMDEGIYTRILISEKDLDTFNTLACRYGWKKIKDRTGDLYLYGMKHFLYYSAENLKLCVCCQLACRSTLNNGWVPLDRKINNQVLEHICTRNNICYLGAEDELCYLTAKCVYTEKVFNKDDIKRIENCMAVISKTALLPKLESIFFKFTDKLFLLLTKREYTDIIASLWRFSSY